MMTELSRGPSGVSRLYTTTPYKNIFKFLSDDSSTVSQPVQNRFEVWLCLTRSLCSPYTPITRRCSRSHRDLTRSMHFNMLPVWGERWWKHHLWLLSRVPLGNLGVLKERMWQSLTFTECIYSPVAGWQLSIQACHRSYFGACCNFSGPDLESL